MTPSTLQRKIRVGYATAFQLTQALIDAGVLGLTGAHGRLTVLVADVDQAQTLVDTAITDGRIELTVDGTARPAITPHKFQASCSATRCSKVFYGGDVHSFSCNRPTTDPIHTEDPS